VAETTTFASVTGIGDGSPSIQQAQVGIREQEPSSLVRLRPHKNKKNKQEGIRPLTGPGGTPPVNNNWYKLLLGGIAVCYGSNFGVVKSLDDCNVDGESGRGRI